MMKTTDLPSAKTSAFVAMGVALLVSSSAFAQSRVYDQTMIVPETPIVDSFEEEEDYNLRLGPIDFLFGIGITAEYNDNITLAPDDLKESDIILTPWAEIDAVWRLSDLNTLRFSLGIGYHKYLQNSEYDSKSVILTPNSALALSFYVGDFRITLSDSFSYQEDPYELVTLSDNATYRRWENQAGIQVDWNVNESVIVTAGYTHYNLWAVDEEFESLERSVDTVYIKPSIQITPAINVGLTASVGYINFKDPTRGNATNLLIGPNVNLQITEYTSVYLEVGYQQYDVDQGANEIYNESSGNIYFRGEIANQLTEAFSHRLGFSKFTEVGYESSYYDIFQVEYAFDWRITEGIRLRPAAFWEHYTTSGGPDDEGDRFGFTIGLGYQLTPSITVDAGYRFLIKDSNLAENDYTQNSFTLSLAYRF